MIRLHPRCSDGKPGALLGILFACATLLSAHAAPAPRWTGMSATVFKTTPTPIMSSGATTQDRSGFLWYGTQSGLIRWDGYQMRRYAADAGRPRAVPDNFIRAVFVDAKGTLWIGTSAGGMARYHPDTDDFTVYPNGPAGVSDGQVAAFADDGEGGLWIGTASGLDHMDAAGKLSRRTDSVLPPFAAGAPERAIEAMRRDRHGGLWIGTRQGLLLRRAGAPKAVPIELASDSSIAPPINALVEDSKGRMWIGTRSMGAFMVAPGSSQAVAVQESGPDPALQKQRVFSIAEVAPNEIWFGTEGGGIVSLDPESGFTRRIRHTPDTPDSLHDNDVYSVYRERSGLIVVGTTEYSSIYDPRPQAVVTVRDTGLPVDGNFTIPSVLVRPDGLVWTGVAGGGVQVIDPQLGGVAQLVPGTAGGLPTGRVLALSNGPDDKVYVGTQQGLYCIDAASKRVQQVTLAGRSPTASSWALAWRDGILWMGGLDGLYALVPDASCAAPAVLRHERTSLGDSRVTALLPLEGGALWIGTRGGLAYLPSPTAPLELLPTGGDRTGRLVPGYISSLALDQRGRLWASTFGGGIQLLERTDKDGSRHFRRIGTAQGMPDIGVNAVLSDQQGAMWASTDNGLARVDPVTLAVRALGPPDGVHITQYWTNAAALTKEGEILFGGLNGLTVVRPEKLATIAYQAPVVVTDIVVNDKPLPPSRYNLPQLGTTAPPPIQITPAGKERGFSLEFAALDFSATDRTRYAYRLVGFDSDWIPTVPGTRRIGYNNLPPGSYTLELRAAGGDGVWSPALAVPVHALPAWHQVEWVRAVALLLAVLLVGSLVQLRTDWYRRRQAELEEMVTQRTAELSASQAMLEKLAYADPLTGLPNRRMFNDELRHMKAQSMRDRTPFTLLLIDLDHFKDVNDSLGHEAGDAVLVEVARRLQLAVREMDRVARLGGDEFAVLLNNTDSESEVGSVAQRMVASLGEPIMFGTETVRVGASIGAAAFHGGHGAEEALYREADLALYQAKSSGRNSWIWYTPIIGAAP